MKLRIIFTILSILAFCHTADAQEKAFTVEVSGQGPALFLIPGATCSADVWESTIQRYQDQYTCHASTLAGYAGVPALSKTPMLEEIKAQLIKYIEKHGNKESVIVGHSIGGWLGLLMASEKPQLTQRLVVVDALPFLSAANNPSITEEQAKAYPVEAMVAQYQGMDSTAFANMQSQVVASMVKKEEARDQILQWSVQSDRKAMAHTMHEMMTTDLRQEIGNIEAKVMVLCAWDQGSEETQRAHHKIYRDQYQELENAEILFSEGARHFIMIDNPEWYFQQLDRFLNKAQP